MPPIKYTSSPSPQHTFDIAPRTGQSFQFTVIAPGKFDVTLRDARQTIASISVQ